MFPEVQATSLHMDIFSNLLRNKNKKGQAKERTKKIAWNFGKVFYDDNEKHETDKIYDEQIWKI